MDYNFPAGMMAMAYQTDEQIAAVLTHVRSNFGNSAPAVTAAELIEPEPPAAGSDKPAAPGAGKYDNLKPSIGPIWAYAAVLLFGLFCLVSVFRK